MRTRIAVTEKVLVEADKIKISYTLRLQNALENPQFLNALGMMRKVRSVKSEYELNKMRKSAKIQANVYNLIPLLYKKGMANVFFQATVEYEMCKGDGENYGL